MRNFSAMSVSLVFDENQVSASITQIGARIILNDSVAV
jgi:hypothetical protein